MALATAFCKQLTRTDFDGECHTDLATRLALSTDNSIYQLIPDAVIYPASADDIEAIFTIANQPDFQELHFTPRAGGTGTDGQSLTNGIVIDCSRFMREIKSIDLSAGTVTVEPGVILDDLNRVLKPNGVFFAPSLSPSNRACIAGMFNTDACGVGSALYGRTSDHVLSVKAVLADGSVINTSDELTLHEQVGKILNGKQDLLHSNLPKMDRFFTGYNIAHCADTTPVNLTKLLSGSEGTLAFMTELTLKLTPIPKHKALLVLKYTSFEAALTQGVSIVPLKPNAIETIDDKIISLARTDEIFLKVKPMFDTDGEDTTTNAINLVQFVASTQEELDKHIQSVMKHVQGDPHINGHYITTQPTDIATWWELRKKSVGLLANLPGNRQPVPFVEDTAVPPEHLPAFIKRFCAILDEHELVYGMFGHVDAGCMHVRPALDMTDPNDAKLVKSISTRVDALTREYGGFFWGEHGAGFRSQFIKDTVGEELYDLMKQIKACFDPSHRLNRGKMFSNDPNIPVVQAGDSLRGSREAMVPEAQRKAFKGAFKCNGNAICMNSVPDIAICPSYKVTRDRIHSPKGRAVLMREYLIEQASDKPTPGFDTQVLEAMNGCLGCKSCVLSCPVAVDVPSFKSDFLSMYYQTHKRPLRDKLIANSEALLAKQYRFRKLSKPFKGLINMVLKKIGLVDSPQVFDGNLDSFYQQNQLSVANIDTIANIEKPVLIVRDMFSHYIEPTLLADVAKVIRACGYTPLLAPAVENGKGRHAKGYLNDFEHVAKQTNERLAPFAAQHIPMVGIEPALTLAFRDEYAKTLKDALSFEVKLLSEWLVNQPIPQNTNTTEPYYFITHCSERSLAPNSSSQWQSVFQRAGLTLNILDAGCCGMAGSYGHEKEHLENSKSLFNLSWADKVNNHGTQLLATGYSCRCQTKRTQQKVLKHPISILSDLLS